MRGVLPYSLFLFCALLRAEDPLSTGAPPPYLPEPETDGTNAAAAADDAAAAASGNALLFAGSGNERLKPDSQPLDLEKIVIRGEDQPRAIKLPRLRRKEDDPLPPQSQIKPTRRQDRLFWTDTLSIGAGSHMSFDVKNNYHMRKYANNVGLLSSFGKSDGFRDGYGVSRMRQDLEYQWLSKDKPQLSLSYSMLGSGLELPEPESSGYLGRERRETAHTMKFKIESYAAGERRLKLFSDIQYAGLEDTASREFRTHLLRLGAIFGSGTWETAFSLEKDRRDHAEALLSRMFVQNTSYPLDDRNSIHYGLGTYLISHRNDFLAQDHYLFFSRQGSEEKGLALSPFVLFTHRATPSLKIFGSYTQIYQTFGFVDSYFGRPELSRPSEFIQPSKNIRFESGANYRLAEAWRCSLLLEQNNYEAMPVTVLEGGAGERKLVSDIWDKGRDTVLAFRVDGELAKTLSLQVFLESHRPRWEIPSLSYTPYQSNRQARIVLDHDPGDYGMSFEYAWNDSFRTFPGDVKLGPRNLLAMHLHVTFSARMLGWLDLESRLGGRDYVTPGYPLPDRSIHGGFSFKI